MHSAKTLHRDIKPENILLDAQKNPKLCDFGFCAIYGNGVQRRTMCGTREYLAPEIARGTSQDEKVDIWCLGILLYELLNKKTPFKANVVFGGLPLPRIKFKKGLSQGVRKLIASMLRLDARKRPSAGEVLESFGFLEGEVVRLKSMQHQGRVFRKEDVKRSVSKSAKNVFYRPKSTVLVMGQSNRNIYFPQSKLQGYNKNFNIYNNVLGHDKLGKQSVQKVNQNPNYSRMNKNLNYNKSFDNFATTISQKNIYKKTKNINHTNQKSHANLNNNFPYEIDRNIYNKNYHNKNITNSNKKNQIFLKNKSNYNNSNITYYKTGVNNKNNFYQNKNGHYSKGNFYNQNNYVNGNGNGYGNVTSHRYIRYDR